MRYFDASTATDLSATAAILSDLRHIAEKSGVKFMVVGAAARDILITHVVGSPPDRATADIDIAVAVSSWADVARLTDSMESTRGSVHKFAVRGTEVDVIPFGKIESNDRTITWSNDHVMNVFGFREAMNAAVQVSLPGELIVAVASLPAQCLLKLFAWRDRRHDDRRDAIDLNTILRAYHEGPYFEELYTAYESLLAKHEFDPALAGAERIGGEASALVAVADRHLVTDLLYAEELFELLIIDMGGNAARNRAMASAFRDGFHGAG
jgi:predicted nucleotidyltransferase